MSRSRSRSRSRERESRRSRYENTERDDRRYGRSDVRGGGGGGRISYEDRYRDERYRGRRPSYEYRQRDPYSQQRFICRRVNGCVNKDQLRSFAKSLRVETIPQRSFAAVSSLFPARVKAYAFVLGEIEDSSFVNGVVDSVIKEIRHLVKLTDVHRSEHALRLRAFCRFLAALRSIGIVRTDLISKLFASILKNGITYTNTRDVWLRSDALLHAIVSSVPWMFTQQRQDDYDDLEDLENLYLVVETCIKSRQISVRKIRSETMSSSSSSSSSDLGQNDEIFYLSESVLDLLQEGRSLLTSTTLFSDGVEDDEDEERSVQKHTTISSKDKDCEVEEEDIEPIFVSSKCSFVSPNALYVFQNADDDTNENRVLAAYRATKTLDRRLIRGLVSDTLLGFYPCAAEAAKELQSSIHVKGRKEPLIVEALLSILLPLTNGRACREKAQSFQCYVTRVLIYLFDAKAYPATFASAVASFVTNIRNIPISVIESFNEIFVFVLSTLRLEWKWDHMVEIQSQGTDLERAWIRSVFRRLLNFVNVKSLRNAVPNELHEMIPEKDACFTWDDHDDDEAFKTLCEKLRDDSTTVEDVSTLLLSLSSTSVEEILTASILSVSSASLAETSAFLEKWAPVYSKIHNDSNNILETASRCWRMQDMRFHEIAVKLLELEIVSLETVVEFCFKHIIKSSTFVSSSYWKLLETLIHRQPLMDKKRLVFSSISKTFAGYYTSNKFQDSSRALDYFRAIASENLEILHEKEEKDEGERDPTLNASTTFAYVPW